MPRSGSKAPDLRPAITLVDKKGKSYRCRSRRSALRAVASDAILSVEDGAKVKAGDVLARIPTEGAKTRDITGGLPRVAELFEARKPKDCAVLAESDGYIEFGKDYKNKRRVILKPKNDKQEPIEYLLPKGKHVSVREGDFVEKGDFIVEGNPSPHDILRIKGVEELAIYLINEIQEVYRLQGVKINDKHIEVIVGRCCRRSKSTNGGDTTLLAGEQVDLLELEEANKKAVGSAASPRRPSGSAWHHQGVAADAFGILGRIVPGDDTRPHRCCGQRQGRYAGRAQGERHRRPAYPGGHRWRHCAHPAHRRRARPRHPGRAGQERAAQLEGPQQAAE